MKKNLKLVAFSAISLMLAGSFFSCGEKEKPFEPFLTVDETPITIETAEAGVYSIVVNSNCEWAAVVENAEWCALDKNSGSGDDVIIATIAENTLCTPRSATVKITSGSLTKFVYVSQAHASEDDIDPTLLIGKWDCVKFSYIAEDKTVSDVAVLSKGCLVIPNMEDKWTFFHTNEVYYNHSLSEGNLIKLTQSGSTYVMPPQEEIDICEALDNVYRFSLKDNELMFYFTGDDNKNLLILKKQ